MSSIFDEFAVGEIPTLTLPLASGYLTINNYKRVFDNDTFTLRFPNEEVKRSIESRLVS